MQLLADAAHSLLYYQRVLRFTENDHLHACVHRPVREPVLRLILRQDPGKKARNAKRQGNSSLWTPNKNTPNHLYSVIHDFSPVNGLHVILIRQYFRPRFCEVAHTTRTNGIHSDPQSKMKGESKPIMSSTKFNRQGACGFSPEMQADRNGGISCRG